MVTSIANFHHAKLPAPGALGHIVGLSTVVPHRQCIVSHYYPVCGPLSAFLDRLGEVVEDDPTPEFYMPAQIDEQIDTGWGN